MDQIEAQEPRHVPVAEVRDRLARWAEEGQHVLRVLPALLDEHERLRIRAETAEQESERLRQDVGEVSEAFRRLMNEVLQPMSETLQKLRSSQRRSPPDR